MNVQPSDRGMWRVVAVRDFWVRLRERGFVISTAINVVVISSLVLIRAFGAGGAPSTFSLGTVGDRQVADGAATLAAKVDLEVVVRDYPDTATAEAALRAGEVEAYVDGERIVGLSVIDQTLGALVQASARNARVNELLDRYEVPPSERDVASDATPLTPQYLEPVDPDRDTNAAIAFIGVILLYGQLFGYGVWVATGVIEEKSSRVVEILLSAVRARQLMAGKIVGIGTLGLAQLTLISGFAICLALVTGAIDVPGSAVSAALLDVGWYALGFAFYASVFAVAGSLVSRMEDLQNAIVPVNLTIFVSFFISIGALRDPDSTVSRVASILPTSSALAMPVRIVLGAARPWEIALALIVIVGSAAALVPLAGRLYSGAVLRTGARVRLRDAWRAAA